MDQPVILHISDIHHGPNHDPSAPDAYAPSDEHYRDRITDEFIEQVKSLSPRPNLLIASGDFTWTALEKEFEEARTFLLRVLESLNIDPRSHLILTPGNHDVSNALFKVSTAYELFPYTIFADRLTHNDGRISYLRRPDEAFRVYDFSEAFSLVVITLNSCVGSAEPRKRSGWLGKRQVREALKESRRRMGTRYKSCIKVAVWHHDPYPDAAGHAFTESMRALNDLANDGDIDIVLHGHTHEPSAYRHSDTLVLGTRALGVSSRWRPLDEALGFQVIQIQRPAPHEKYQAVVQTARLNSWQRWELTEPSTAPLRTEFDPTHEHYFILRAEREGTTAASVLLLNHDHSGFWLYQNSKYNLWLCPGDRTNPNEFLHDCAIRAVRTKVNVSCTFLPTVHQPTEEEAIDGKHWKVPSPIFSVVESEIHDKHHDFPYRCNYYFIGTVNEEDIPSSLPRPGRWFKFDDLAVMQASGLIPSDLPGVIERLLSFLAV